MHCLWMYFLVFTYIYMSYPYTFHLSDNQLSEIYFKFESQTSSRGRA